MRINTRVGIPGNGRSHYITNAQRKRSAFFGRTQGCQRICRFTALRNHQHHVIFINQGFAVTKFRSVFYLYRQFGQMLKQVFSNQSGMPAGTASRNNQSLGIHQLIQYIGNTAQLYRMIFYVKPSAQTIRNGARLFKNLFEHKVRITTFLNLLNTHRQLMHFLRKRLILDGLYLISIFRNNGHFSVIQINNLFGVLNNGRSIRSHKHFIITDTQQQRRPFPGYDDAIGLFNIQNGQSIRSYHLLQGHLHGLFKGNFFTVPIFVNLFDQLSNNFRISIGMECPTLIFQLLLQGIVILNNAIVYKRNFPRFTYVRMRIYVIRCSVCCPPGMPNTNEAVTGISF